MKDGARYRDTLLPLTEDETRDGRAGGAGTTARILGEAWFGPSLPGIVKPPERSRPRPLRLPESSDLASDSTEHLDQRDRRGDSVAPDEGLRWAVAARSAATAEVLRWVVRCAREGTYRERGFRTMTDFLSTELAIGLATAKEWVFLSRKLAELPRTFEAFERGRLTWEQIRLVARFATPETDGHWAKAAPGMYPSKLWRELQRRTRPRLKDERAAHASRYLRLVWDADHPVLYVEGRLGKEQGSRLEEAIRARSREIPPDPGADDPSEARRADALVELATGVGTEPSARAGDGASAGPDGRDNGGDRNGRARRDTVVVHTDFATLTRTAPKSGPWLAETEQGRTLHPETVRRIACDADIERVDEIGGHVIGIGRKSPRVPAWLERAVRHRDGAMCRFPGCERRIALLSHHIRHWADGGGTDLDNLVTLCGGHHRYVHEDGWRIGGGPGGMLRFHDPTGRALARASPTTAA